MTTATSTPRGPGRLQQAMNPWPRELLVCVVFVVLVAAFSVAPAEESSPPPGGMLKEKGEALTIEDLPEHWQVWLEEEVYPLISRDQQKAFLRLETEAQRQAFADRLWVLWGRQTGYGARFRAVYEQRIRMCRENFEHMRSDRARILLLHGPPDFQIRSRCEMVFHPLEIWGWSYIEGLGQEVVALFYVPYGVGNYRFWQDFDGRSALYTSNTWQQIQGGQFTTHLDRPEIRCPNGEQILALISRAAMWSRDTSYLFMMTHLPDREGRGPESSSKRFMEFSALLDEESLPLDFFVSDDERGLQGGQIRMGFDLKVPAENLGTMSVGDIDVVQLDVVGEIAREGSMVDRFRYLFSVPKAEDVVVLRIERFVRPGDYDVRLKVEDVHSPHAGVFDGEFDADMARAELAQQVVEERRRQLVQTLDVDEPRDDGEVPVLQLVVPQGEAISGLKRFEAVTRSDVKKVTFFLDGREILTKNRPPFDIDLDLGPLPRLTTIAVAAFDADGRQLAREEAALNVGRERFFLRLQPITVSDIEGGRVRVRAEVNTPSDVDLERLDVYWNERLLTTLYQPPFEAWVNIGDRGQLGYLRALAVLVDGSEAEDLQFLNAPEFGSVVQVTSVELPVTVLDREGKPVKNLSAEDFQVFEDGVEQEVTHFSLLEDLPVRLGIVIDSSGSMETTLPVVQRVVMGFLRQLLRPKDRAFIETFSDKPDLLAPFTADFETLENALLALYPDRATALYDAAIMGLFQFSGVRGRKAMVIVTDGDDTASKFTYGEVKDFAMRAGVAIYTIGIDLSAARVVTRFQLKKLAEVTGGRAFFVSDNNELDRIYEEIDAEIRTQYALAFTSTSTSPPDELRRIKVRVNRAGVEVRTIAGYFPVAF